MADILALARSLAAEIPLDYFCYVSWKQHWGTLGNVQGICRVLEDALLERTSDQPFYFQGIAEHTGQLHLAVLAVLLFHTWPTAFVMQLPQVWTEESEYIVLFGSGPLVGEKIDADIGVSVLSDEGDIGFRLENCSPHHYAELMRLARISGHRLWLRIPPQVWTEGYWLDVTQIESQPHAGKRALSLTIRGQRRSQPFAGERSLPSEDDALDASPASNRST